MAQDLYDLSTFGTSPRTRTTDDDLYDLSSFGMPEPEPTPDEPMDYWGAIKTGWNNMLTSSQATANIMGLGSDESLATSLKDLWSRAQVQAPEQVRQFQENIMAEGRDVSEAEGFINTAVEVGDLLGTAIMEAWDKPKALGYTILESAANALPSIVGATAGIPLGAPGFAGGQAAGTWMVETGAKFTERVAERLQDRGITNLQDATERDILSVLQDPEFREEAESDAAKAGLASSVVEFVFARMGLGVINKAKDAGRLKKLGAGIGATGIESAGEFSQEIALDVAAGDEADYGEAGIAFISSLGQSGATTGIGYLTQSRQEQRRKEFEQRQREFTEQANKMREQDRTVPKKGDALDQQNEQVTESLSESLQEPAQTVDDELTQLNEDLSAIQDEINQVERSSFTPEMKRTELARLDQEFQQRQEQYRELKAMEAQEGETRVQAQERKAAEPEAEAKPTEIDKATDELLDLALQASDITASERPQAEKQVELEKIAEQREKVTTRLDNLRAKEDRAQRIEMMKRRADPEERRLQQALYGKEVTQEKAQELREAEVTQDIVLKDGEELYSSRNVAQRVATRLSEDTDTTYEVAEKNGRYAVVTPRGRKIIESEKALRQDIELATRPEPTPEPTPAPEPSPDVVRPIEPEPVVQTEAQRQAELTEQRKTRLVTPKEPSLTQVGEPQPQAEMTVPVDKPKAVAPETVPENVLVRPKTKAGVVPFKTEQQARNWASKNKTARTQLKGKEFEVVPVGDGFGIKVLTKEEVATRKQAEQEAKQKEKAAAERQQLIEKKKAPKKARVEKKKAKQVAKVAPKQTKQMAKSQRGDVAVKPTTKAKPKPTMEQAAKADKFESNPKEATEAGVALTKQENQNAKPLSKEQTADKKSVAEKGKTASTKKSTTAKTLQEQLSQNNNVKAVANWLADVKNNVDAGYRKLAEQIQQYLPDDLSIITYSKDEKPPSFAGKKIAARIKNMAGAYLEAIDKDGNVTNRQILMKDDSWKSNPYSQEQIILHEMLHAATNERIRAAKREGADPALVEAVSNLKDLQDSIMSYLDMMEIEGRLNNQQLLAKQEIKSLDELIPWALTDPEFQQVLQEISYRDKTVWDRFVEAIGKVLGLNPDQATALSEVLSVTSQLLDARIDTRISAMAEDAKADLKTSSYRHESRVPPELRQQHQDLEIERDNALIDEYLQTEIGAKKKRQALDVKISALEEQMATHTQERLGGKPALNDMPDSVRAMQETKLAGFEQRSWRQSITAWFKESLIWQAIEHIKSYDWMVQGFVNDLHGLERIEKINNNGKRLVGNLSATVLAYFAKNSGVMAQTALYNHPIKYQDGQIVLDTDNKSLQAILEPIATMGQDHLSLWASYVAAIRAQSLMKQGREKHFTQEQIDETIAYVESKPGLKKVFDQAQKEWVAFNKNNLDIAQQFGVLTAEQRKTWEEDTYVPFFRESEAQHTQAPKKAKRIGDPKSPGQRLKGGEGKIDILGNMAKNTMHIIDIAMKNRAMQLAVKESLDAGAMTKLQAIPQKDPYKEGVVKNLEAMLAEERVEPTKEMMDLFKHLSRRLSPLGENTVSVYRDGKVEYYTVEDPLLLRSLKTLGVPNNNKIMQVLGIPTRLLSKTITSMPNFLANNFIRDTQNAFFTSHDNSRKAAINAIKNVGKLTKDDLAVLQLQAAGAISTSQYYSNKPDDFRKEMKSISRGMDGANIAKNWWRKYMKLAVATENANRVAIFNETMANTGNYAEAVFRAGDIMPFHRRGDHAIMEAMITFIPFINPRIQGLSRIVRGAKEDKRAFMRKAAYYVGLSFALAAYNWEVNEEDMDRLKEEERDLYHHFWFGDQHIRIAKPFEYGQVFGSFPERMYEQISQEYPEPVANSIKRFAQTTFGLQYPQFMKPIDEASSNWDSFRQAPILSYGMQKKKAELQYDAWTNKLMIDLANAMPDFMPDSWRSPKILQHVIQGYFGSMSYTAMYLADKMYETTGMAPDMPELQLGQMPVIRAVYEGSHTKTSRYLGRFYTMLKEVEKLRAQEAQLREERRIADIRELRLENRDLLRARASLNKTSRRLNSIKKRINKVMESRTMTSEQKYSELQKLTKQRNEIATKVVQKYWYAFH